MPDYVLGLLTVPALAGSIAALAGLWWLAGKGLDWITVRFPPRKLDTHARVALATVVIRTRRVHLLRIGEFLALGVFAGRCDQFGDAADVYTAIDSALAPRPNPSPPSDRWRADQEDHRG